MNPPDDADDTLDPSLLVVVFTDRSPEIKVGLFLPVVVKNVEHSKPKQTQD